MKQLSEALEGKVTLADRVAVVQSVAAESALDGSLNLLNCFYGQDELHRVTLLLEHFLWPCSADDQATLHKIFHWNSECFLKLSFCAFSCFFVLDIGL